MTIKAVFFDMDGTLLTDQRSIRPSTIQAINALKKKGILVGLATGRGPQFVLPYMAALGLDLAITYNGQYILSRTNVLHNQALEKADITALLAYANQHHLDLSLGLAKGTTGSQIMTVGTGNIGYWLARLVPHSWAGLINFIFNRIIRTIRPQNREQLQSISASQPVYQLMLLATERETNRLQQAFPHLTFTRSSPYSADIISKGVSKLKGIQLVGEQYGFEVSEAMVFGDSNNDLEMLKGAGIGVAMGNATRKAKAFANHITASNNHDGIAQALIAYGVIDPLVD